MFALARKLVSVLNSVGIRTAVLVFLWVLFAPAIWIYGRFFPRKRDRILFWTHEGFRVAPSRVRSYGFCREIKKQGVDARVLSFWDHIAHYQGLPPFDIPLHERTLILFRAMVEAIHSRAGILITQRPVYDFIPLTGLKLMYPLSFRIWADIDDWILDDSFENRIRFRDLLPIQSLISEGCVVSSLPLLRELRKHYKRVEIIPTFPDASLFVPSVDPDREHRTVVFSWTGTFFSEEIIKDVIFLIRVLESLKDTRVTFHVLGKGAYLQETRRQAHKIARHANVQFLGWKDPETMPEYYAEIDVGLYALTTHTIFYRSKSPTKLFEYMACGKASVSTDFGEAPRFIEHGVTGFVASGFVDFASSCAALMNDPELRATMGRNARMKIERDYNIAKAADTVRHIVLPGSSK
jgi:glycosyltransferase involved in cell wall biosynthesis